VNDVFGLYGDSSDYIYSDANVKSTIIFVCKMTTVTSKMLATTNSDLLITNNSTGFTLTTSGGMSTIRAAAASGQWHIVVANVHLNHCALWIDGGVSSGYASLGNNFFASTSSLKLSGAGDYWLLGIIRDEITEANRQSLEGWAAYYAGLRGNLPSWHPYKSALPTSLGIGTLPDRSGNSRDYLRSSFVRPTAVSGDLNGSTVLDFQTDAQLSPAISQSYPFIPGSAGAIFFVLKPTRSCTILGETGDYFFTITFEGDETYTLWRNGSPVCSAPGVTDEYSVVSINLSSTSASLSVNGADPAVGSITMPFSLEASAQLQPTGSLRFLCLSGSAFTQSQVDTMVGYLAWQCGLESNLPPTHPYANSAPGVDAVAAIAVYLNSMPGSLSAIPIPGTNYF
jgi:hypothetical protein